MLPKGSQVLSYAQMSALGNLEGEVIYVMFRPSSGVERCMLPMTFYLPALSVMHIGEGCPRY